jgi:hypothetical protein
MLGDNELSTLPGFFVQHDRRLQGIMVIASEDRSKGTARFYSATAETIHLCVHL